MKRILFVVFAAGALCLSSWAQQGQSQQQPSTDKKASQQDQQDEPKAEDLSDDLTFPGDRPGANQSSSKSTKIDLRPPMGDAASHPNSGIADDVMEVHVWDPHKADKNVEVGDFYYKRKNYTAAAARYREALKWKDNDAIAMFKLGQASEKIGKLDDARESYENYLKTLPEGPNAEDAKKALEKLPKAPPEEKKSIGELKTK